MLQTNSPRHRLATLAVSRLQPILEHDTVLLMLLLGDALFLALNLLQLATPFFRDPAFSIEAERGFGETYQYLKAYWASMLTLFIAVSRRKPLYAVWSVLFAYVLVDDMFTLHEHAGAVVAARLPSVSWSPLRGQDVGEAMYAAALGSMFLTVGALVYRTSDSHTRRDTIQLLRLIVYFAAFAVGLDLVHETSGRGVLHTAVGLVEEGGEMVLMSIIVAVAARFYGHNSRALATPHSPSQPSPGRFR